MTPNDLNIQVGEIPAAGRVIEGELPPDWLRDSLLPAYTGSTPVAIKLEVRGLNDTVFVEGVATATLNFKCSRTMVDATTEIEATFSELYLPEGRHGANLSEGIDADAFDEGHLYAIVDNKIDLAGLIKEELVLAQDPYPRVEGAVPGDDSLPVWTNDQVEVDPRWAALSKLKLD